MVVYDRSALEIIYNDCITDNINLEIGIYRQNNDRWDYTPPDQALNKNHTYMAIFKLINIGVEIDFADVQLRIKKTAHTLPVTFYKELGGDPCERIDFLDIPKLVSPDGGNRKPSEIYRTIYFSPLQKIEANERDKLFAVGIFATIVPQGHHWQGADQQHFHTPILAMPDELNFGIVPVNSSATKQFEIINVGSGIYRVGSYSTYSNHPEDFKIPANILFSIEPGATKALSIEFTPSEMGDFWYHLILNGNDPANPSVTAQFKGKGTYSFVASPETLNFGRVPVQQAKRMIVKLRNYGTTDVVVSNLHLTGSYFSCNQATPFAIRANTAVNLEISFSPVRKGTRAGKLTITSNYSPRRTIEINLNAEGIHWLEAIPEQKNFGNIRVGQSSSEAKIKVRNWHSSTCVITKVSFIGSNQDFLYIFPQVNNYEFKSGRTVEIAQVVARPQQTGQRIGYVRVSHKIKGAPRGNVLYVKCTVNGT